MQDPTREEEPDQRQLSTCIANEPNPRWGDKFDFIDVSPTSTLLVQVSSLLRLCCCCSAVPDCDSRRSCLTDLGQHLSLWYSSHSVGDDKPGHGQRGLQPKGEEEC